VQLEDVVEQAIRRHEVFSAADREIDALTVTERSPDGSVEVTVRSSGALMELTCTDRIRTMPPQQVAATVRACVQAAQAGIARRVQEILRQAAPGDPLVDELVAQADKAFAPPPAAPSTPPGTAPRGLGIGEIQADPLRPQPAYRPLAPAARPRPDDGHHPQPAYRPAGRPRPATRPDDDSEDWGGRSVLS
jgi:hypothetical protein